MIINEEKKEYFSRLKDTFSKVKIPFIPCFNGSDGIFTFEKVSFRREKYSFFSSLIIICPPV